MINKFFKKILKNKHLNKNRKKKIANTNNNSFFTHNLSINSFKDTSTFNSSRHNNNFFTKDLCRESFTAKTMDYNKRNFYSNKMNYKYLNHNYSNISNANLLLLFESEKKN